MLQSKPVAREENGESAEPSSSVFGSIDAIRAIQTRAHEISAVFAKLCR